MNKIYFSKPGLVTSCADNAEEFWTSILKGNQEGIKECRALNGKSFFASRIEENNLSETRARFNMKIIRIEEKALLQIKSQIEKVIERYGSEKVAVCIGSCDNGSEFSFKAHKSFFESGNFFKDYSLEMQGADYVATYVKEKFLLKGPCLAFSTACSSSSIAIIKASQLIKSGLCDAVICGGVDIASDTVLLGFDSLGAVSDEKTNPFSKNRKGITLGDGAAFFVMSKENIFETEDFFLAGYGESADAYHMTSPDPSACGAISCMNDALKNAGLLQSDIDYVNLHGTGTKFNDSMEAKALDNVFNSRKVLCSSTKAVTGHTLGAAGALELAACYLALKNNVSDKWILPSHVWDGFYDEEMPELNFVKTAFEYQTGKKIKYCMSNSFAFGGSNVSLIIGRE